LQNLKIEQAFLAQKMKRDIQKRIKILLDEDQQDRKSSKLLKKTPKARWEIIQKNDDLRREEVSTILKNNNEFRGVDYFRIGLIFQHGTTLDSIRQARDLAKKGIEKEHKKSRWLYAATTDRLLMMQKKKQKYGTQFYLDTKTKEWALHPVSERTTDEDRAFYNIKPLHLVKKTVVFMNRNPRFVRNKEAGISSK
jgi:hypothetical protein